MDILMATSELVGIAKVGGLADAVAALSKTLKTMGHNVTIAMPRYQVVEEAGLMVARRLTKLAVEVDLGEEGEALTYPVTLFDARLASGVELLLIDIPGQFDRPGVYGDGGVDYEDNARRFGLFCRALAAVVEMRASEGGAFDVVHAHDWPTALLPYLLRGGDIRTVLTIHNGAHQGLFPKEAMDDIGLNWDDFHPAGLEFHGQLNLLKAGVLSADVVTTVSPSYADELSTPAGGAGLDGVYSSLAAPLTGIVNGIDYALWSPATDPHLHQRYDAEDASNKGRCKAALLHELEMAIDPDRPLLVALGRIDAQKGSDLLAEAIVPIVRTDAQLVIAGDGDPELVDVLAEAAGQASPDARYLGRVSEPTAHRLLSAADAVLLPSRFEPCGLVQQYAQRYGALPIAHAVGGLKDTVVDCDMKLETGTGFLFTEPTSEALVGAVQRAVAAMATPAWGTLRRRVMRLDRSWEGASRRYVQLYR